MEKLETIVFRWTRNHGDCYDCGKPAAFQTNLKIKLCCLCAANCAADGEQITRIDPFFDDEDE